MASSPRSSVPASALEAAGPPTIKDVASTAGVSIGTVSNFLNRPSSVAPSTRDKVQRAIEKLGFVRNAGAALIRSARARTVGLVVLDVTNPFFTELARGAEEAAREHDLLVILCNSDEDVDKEQRYLELLAEQRVLGVLISAVDSAAAGIDRIRRRGTAVVLVENARTNFCSVRVDDVAGGELAAEHLIALGHRELAYVSASLSVRQYRERLAGVRRAMARHGLLETALTVVEQGLKGGTMDGRLAAERMLSGRLPATGVICGNDLMALGVTAALARSGVVIPEDVSVVGYDDIELSQHGVVALTTVAQPKHNMGRTAAQLLVEEAERGDRHSHQQIVFHPEIVVRESTAPPPAGRTGAQTMTSLGN